MINQKSSSSPDFEYPAYKKIKEELELRQAIHGGIVELRHYDFDKKILPIEAAEEISDYQKRLDWAAHIFDNRYSRHLNTYSSMLSDIYFEGALPKSLLENLTDVDTNGSNLRSFAKELILAALIDDIAYVYVDYRDGDRPYVTLLKRSDLINQFDDVWVFRGQEYLRDGAFGGSERTTYTVYQPGGADVYASVDREIKLIRSSTATDRRGQPLQQTPIAVFDIKTSLGSMAHLTAHLWRQRVDVATNLHMCNCPTPVIKRSDVYDANGNVKSNPLVLGRHSYVSLYDDWGEAFFLEPTGSAIEQSRQEIEATLKEIDSQGTAFLGQDSHVAKTATEVEVSNQSSQSTISGVAIELESGWEEVLFYWSLYTGESYDGKILHASARTLDESADDQYKRAEPKTEAVEVNDEQPA